MSRRRFQQITRVSCLYDEDEEEETGRSVRTNSNYDPNYKVTRRIQLFCATSEMLLFPVGIIVIDETQINYLDNSGGQSYSAVLCNVSDVAYPSGHYCHRRDANQVSGPFQIQEGQQREAEPR